MRSTTTNESVSVGFRSGGLEVVSGVEDLVAIGAEADQLVCGKGCTAVGALQV